MSLRRHVDAPPQVVSLHSLGGPLASCCAVSYGSSVYVYPVTLAAGGQPPPVKASWVAHHTAITAMHRAAFGAQLITGAADGSIHLCAPCG